MFTYVWLLPLQSLRPQSTGSEHSRWQDCLREILSRTGSVTRKISKRITAVRTQFRFSRVLTLNKELRYELPATLLSREDSRETLSYLATGRLERVNLLIAVTAQFATYSSFAVITNYETILNAKG